MLERAPSIVVVYGCFVEVLPLGEDLVIENVAIEVSTVRLVSIRDCCLRFLFLRSWA